MTSISNSYQGSMYGGIADAFARRLQQKRAESAASGTENASESFSGLGKTDTLQPLDPVDNSLSLGAVGEPVKEHKNTFHYSTQRSETELAIYWSMPSCVGSDLLPEIGTESERLVRENPAEYAELSALKKERYDDVMETYGLNGITRPEFYMKTTGPQAVEMTDHYYNGFDERGRELIKKLFPAVSEHYGW